MASLAIRCLAAVPSERPAHAGEVAVAVTAALTRSADEHRQAELNLMRTDVEIGYEKRSWFTSWLKAIGLLLLLGLIWLFGYGYRAMTVQEAEWTAKKEKDLQFLQKMTGQRSPRRKTNAALRRRMRSSD